MAVLSFLFGGNELNVRRTRVLRLRFGRRHGRIPVDKFGAGRAIQIVLASGRAKKARSSEIGKPRRVCMRDSFTLFE